MSVPTLPTSPPPTTYSKSVEEEVIERIAPRKFHRSFTLPATTDHGPLRVTYGIAGKDDGEDTPTILFCGGMFGSRWQAVFQNHVAKLEGVRVIYVDRPGFGGTTPVSLTNRLPTFLEIIPALLAHLNIKTISLGSQSAGTTFALNLLLTCPHLLSPTHPSITLFSPWVHQSITGTTMLLAASRLPNFLLNHWADLTGFIINSAMPTFASSSGFLSAVGSWFGSSVPTSASSKADVKRDEEYFERFCLAHYGVGVEAQKELNTQVMKYAFAEESSGGNDEARLCLKSVEGTSWGVLEDYPSYIAKLKDVWEKKVAEGSPKLVVRVLLAEEDVMIGEKGKTYMEECWTKEKCGEGIDVEVVTLEGTDHDSVLDPGKGAMGEMFKALREERAAFQFAEGESWEPAADEENVLRSE